MFEYFCLPVIVIGGLVALHQIVDLIWPGDHRRRDHGPGNNSFTKF